MSEYINDSDMTLVATPCYLNVDLLIVDCSKAVSSFIVSIRKIIRIIRQIKANSVQFERHRWGQLLNSYV